MASNYRNSSVWYDGLVRRSKNIKYFPTVKTLTGKMVFFTYQTPLKQRLGHFDKNPLVFVLTLENGYILGLNVHYLNMVNRKILVDALHRLNADTKKVANGGDTEEEIQQKFRYSNIIRFLRTEHVKHCIKKYKVTNIKNIAMVLPSDWNQIVHLPLQEFVRTH